MGDHLCRVTRGLPPRRPRQVHLGPLLPDAFRRLRRGEPHLGCLPQRPPLGRPGLQRPRPCRYFPWMQYGLNVMEWALTWPEARTQLVNWEEEWAMPLVAQLRVHAEQWRTDGRMRAVIETVRADPTARQTLGCPRLGRHHPPLIGKATPPLPGGPGSRNSPSGSSREHPTNFPRTASWIVTPAQEVSGD
ncbi:hypothetical protein ACRAWF_26700 [Streptomyces sp. L7]